jgi:hypothetical protein
VPAGAALSEADPLVQTDMDKLAAGIANQPGTGSSSVIVMGQGPFDWEGVNAAKALAARGVTKLAWYRGGEEAWAKAGMPAQDRRSP